MRMNKTTKFIVTFFLLSQLLCTAQIEQKLVSLTIPKALKENANAVVRANDIVVEIKDFNLVKVTQDRIITVLNEAGMKNVGAYEPYSNSRKIKNIEVYIYDELGNEIERIKGRDFKDVSAVDGGTLYADNRVKHMDYIPRSYPVTFHYTSEVIYKSTAFLPQWRPLEGFYVSTESSTFKVINGENINLKHKEVNFDDYEIREIAPLSYAVKNLLAIKNEVFRPDFKFIAPCLQLALTDFEMEGVVGVNNTWTDFGKWMYDELLADTRELPEEAIQEIKTLTKSANTAIEKARIVYQYVQDRSRYISVQVGIGGWKPIDAADVHKMAYGDCKGLTNYTMALLNEVGVNSSYAVIYGGSNIESIDPEFSKVEGNHVILYLPKLDQDEDYWLECTSKSTPFGFMSDFTDDRDALVITEDGGKIVHTPKYDSKQSLQKTCGVFDIDQDGSLLGQVELMSRGVQYSWRSDISTKSVAELKKSYLQLWSHLNGLSVINASNSNDKIVPEFKEQVEIKIDRYASKTGNLLLFQPVILNRHNIELPPYDERAFDIDIQRGYLDEDYYDIVFKEGLKVDALPDPVELKTKFGTYSLNVEVKDDTTVSVERRLEINAGVFDKTDYLEYRAFKSAIIKHDNSRGVFKLTK